jgi:hypothetical protein
MSAGFRGHHDTSKFHWLAVEISHTTSPPGTLLFGFQHKMRLSLPQLTSRSGSWGHQAMDSTPLHQEHFKTFQNTFSTKCIIPYTLTHKAEWLNASHVQLQGFKFAVTTS